MDELSSFILNNPDKIKIGAGLVGMAIRFILDLIHKKDTPMAALFTTGSASITAVCLFFVLLAYFDVRFSALQRDAVGEVAILLVIGIIFLIREIIKK